MEEERTHLFLLLNRKSQMNIQEAREWTRYTFETLDCPELIDATKIEFNNRMTVAMGTAQYFKNKRSYSYDGETRCTTFKNQGLIKLSRKLFDRASEKDQIETVIHEACHIVDRHLNNPRCKKTEGHGPTWKALMEKCGIEPKRYHHVCNKGLRKKTRVHLECTVCNHLYKITKHRWSRGGRSTSSWRCKCSGSLKFNGIFTEG